MPYVAPSSAEVTSLQYFNRLYTQKFGLLNERLDGSPHSLPEARVLYELAHGSELTAAMIGRSLDIDKGQLSKILTKFERDGLVTTSVSTRHAKQRLLALTDAGRASFQALDTSTGSAIAGLLGEMDLHMRTRLLESTGVMTSLLEPQLADQPAFALRPLQIGDLGWITHRQAILYAQEYGWDLSYEALVAEILASFAKGFDEAREQAWIAGKSGAIVGSIFLMRSPDSTIAKLRLLYVEPSARGLGIGKTLVDACLTQARTFGYRRIELWTNTVLVSARRIYEAAGFKLLSEESHHSFGHDLTGQIWFLDL